MAILLPGLLAVLAVLAGALVVRRVHARLAVRPRISHADLEKLSAEWFGVTTPVRGEIDTPPYGMREVCRSKTGIQAQSRATYTFTDTSGVTKTYSCLDEMPPDIRSFFSQFGAS